MSNRLIIITDPGLDDAIALIYMMKKIPQNVKIDVFCVGGNNPAHISLENAKYILRSFSDRDITLWSTDVIRQKYKILTEIHGKRRFKVIDSQIPVKNFPKDWRPVEEECDLLVLASCTIPLMLDIPSKYLQNIVVMGGGINQTNYENLEFNQAMDIVSFELFLKKYEDKILMVTIDSCRNETFDLYNERKLSLMSRSDYEYEFCKEYIECALKRSSQRCIPYDLVAAFVFLNKDELETERSNLICVDKNIRPLCLKNIMISDPKIFWKMIWGKDNV